MMCAIGMPRPCEIHIRVLDSNSDPVSRVTVEHVLSRGLDVIKTSYLPGETDTDGYIAIPMMLGGASTSKTYYGWGLAVHTSNSQGTNGWQFLWGLMDRRGPEVVSKLILRGADGEKVQVLEEQLRSLPVDRRVRHEQSLFKEMRNAAQFSQDQMVDVSTFVVMIVRAVPTK
jgi:hypothetical protein